MQRQRLIMEHLERRIVLDAVGADATPAELRSYIVVLNDDVAEPAEIAQSLASANRGKVGFIYEHALKGFSAYLPASAIEALSKNSQIKYIEPDGVMHASAQTLPTGVDRIDADTNPTAGIDNNPGSLDVDVAIIDTGIDIDHPDLNVVGGAYAEEGGGPPWARSVSMVEDPAKYNDGNGHGSHVAGTVAAIDNEIGAVGVAPGARLWAVKVLEDNGSGSYGQVIAGADWVAATRTDTDPNNDIEVANASLGGSFSQSVNDAFKGMVDLGIFVAVAAGNNGANAGSYSPASEPSVITVSAAVDTDGAPGGFGTDSSYGPDDTLASFSNYGSVVDIAAPGVSIFSTWKDGGYNTISGTSMASPHVAGAAALYIAENGAAANGSDVQSIRNALVSAGEPMAEWRADSLDTDSDPDSSHEPLLYVGSGGAVDLPPSIAITNPSDSESVSGTVIIMATASDDNNVDQVEFFVNGTSIHVDSNGGDGWSASWDTTAFAEDSTHTVTAVATDSALQTNSDSVSVLVDNVENSETTMMHVADLDAAVQVKGKSGKWEVFVTVSIVDNGGNPVANATVDGAWSGATTGTVSGPTDSSGLVTFGTGNMNGGADVTFTVTDVTHGTLEYNSDENTDPDPDLEEDSDGTTITVGNPSIGSAVASTVSAGTLQTSSSSLASQASDNESIVDSAVVDFAIESLQLTSPRVSLASEPDALRSTAGGMTSGDLHDASLLSLEDEFAKTAVDVAFNELVNAK